MSLGSKGLITSTKTQSASASASLAASDSDNDSKGLPKGALIAIIVCAVVIGVAAIAWTLFRKWKLRPSKGFDQRMQPIDFSPNNNTDMGDDFFEKTMARDADAERQRQQFVTELDKDATLVGDLQHDFTAGPATGTYGYQPDPYGGPGGADPYARTDGYDFSAPRNDWDYPQVPDAAATGYPPQPGVGAGVGAYYAGDYPTQDTADHAGSYGDHHSNQGHGYADLQRGPSVGHSASGHVQPQEFNPLGGSDFAISGRPTDSSAGPASPYAQAATYRY